jgi:membrane protein DedA with SNARE-associated domain
MLLNSGTLVQWVSTHGYPYLGAVLLLAAAGVPLPTEILLVALGALSARDGGPSLFVLVAFGTAATVAGDALDYWLGRILGATAVVRWLKRRVPVRERGASIEGGAPLPREWIRQLVERSGSGTMIFLSRWVLTPLQTPVSLLAGASGRPFRTFLIWDLCGEACYVLSYLLLGRAGGALVTSAPLLLALGVAAALVSCVPLLLARWMEGRQCGARLLPQHGGDCARLEIRR